MRLGRAADTAANGMPFWTNSPTETAMWSMWMSPMTNPRPSGWWSMVTAAASTSATRPLYTANTQSPRRLRVDRLVDLVDEGDVALGRVARVAGGDDLPGRARGDSGSGFGRNA